VFAFGHLICPLGSGAGVFHFRHPHSQCAAALSQSWFRPLQQSKEVDFNFELQLLLSKFSALSMDFVFIVLS